MNVPQTRPLVVRFGAFGDLVLLTPALQMLRARFGQPVDIVTSGAWARPLLTGQPGVGDLLTVSSRRTPYWFSRDQQRFVHWLRGRGIGPVWYCDGTTAARPLLARGGINSEWVCDMTQLAYVPGEHQVERLLRLAQSVPRAIAHAAPPLPAVAPANAALQLQDAGIADLTDWLQRRGLAGHPLIGVQAGNRRLMRTGLRRRTNSTKYWPATRWGEVIRAVRSALPSHAILLLGVADEFSMNSDIARAADVAGLHNVAGELPIPVLLPLLARCHSLISVDTGPAHAAAALGCPTVALFGTADPVRLRPGGVSTPATSLVGQVDGHQNVLGIKPRSVIDAWLALTHGCEVFSPPVLRPENADR